MTNHRRSFKTREAAEAFQLARAAKAWCPLHPALRGDVYMEDQQCVGGRVHIYSYRARCRDGQIREFFASYVGA